MIICDGCKKEIKPYESKTEISTGTEYRHYCRKCSPLFPIV
jgi:hypothetical protein